MSMFTIGSPAYLTIASKHTHSFNQVFSLFYHQRIDYSKQNDAMPFIVTVFSLIIFQFIRITSLSSECESSTAIWTYYPCSFIISSSSFYCQQASISSSIDQCTNREITFFWHFPLGNMTITLESDTNRPFLLRLFKVSLAKRKLIKNIYHLIKNKNIEEQLLNDDDNEEITIPSNEYHQCSIKFETLNRLIFDYGTFIRMKIMTDDNNYYY